VSGAFDALAAAGYFAPLDVHFARSAAALVGEEREEVMLGLALSSRQTREGHVCADLSRLAGGRAIDAAGEPIEGARFPEAAAWHAALEESRLVSDGSRLAPLVLSGGRRLYLRRYWEHEQRLAGLLRERAGLHDEALDAAVLRPALVRLFGPAPGEPDWQRIAVQLALLERLVVVSGGPGTGKTSSVVKLLALLIEQSKSQGRERPRMLLLAPTGKAAARLEESVQQARAGLDCDEQVRAAIPERALTVHRALRGIRGSRTRFRHDREHPLIADLVLVDESSMVDVALMRRLLEAVPHQARLVLLGDRNQLSSVAAGAVLADICGERSTAAYSEALGRRVQSVFGESLPGAGGRAGGIADSVVELTRSYRFSDDSGIGALARAVRDRDADLALSLLRAGADGVALVEGGDRTELGRAAVEGFRPCLEAREPLQALAALSRYRVLCAHRRGPAGVEQLNADIERALEQVGTLWPSGTWYPGRPVLVTQNDYQLSLFNGDVGIVFPDAASGGLGACFAAADGSARVLAPSRLPPHETVFAMTVHKSQGSEFDDMAVVLPDERSPLLGRELLYTAVTRARRSVTLYADEAAVRAAVARRVERASGLGELLWGS